MPSHGFGRPDGGCVALAPDVAAGDDLFDVTNWGRGPVGVDIPDRAILGQGAQRQAHRAFAALTGGGNHVMAVGCCAVAGDFAIDFGTTGNRTLAFL